MASDVPASSSPAAELSADDKKDKDKVKATTTLKKAFDDYTKQAAVEPLAVKLATTSATIAWRLTLCGRS